MSKTDSNVKPSVIETYTELYNELTRSGLREEDIIVLIQRRTRPKVNITDVRATIKAIKTFAEQIEKLRV